ncbi:hypothetical protein N0V83_007735 [Neocucurbitaria cava]|uniref:Xylanolytic transcriptional activator regulatory domain-containing protein n=1 Tax=Neocucurbitaria cava TaxID=798079 RepID=A0A9W8Y5E0_9PLEO|nr:hypothetical protein N0V83_007735 [Neocucurbitaria cava]
MPSVPRKESGSLQGDKPELLCDNDGVPAPVHIVNGLLPGYVKPIPKCWTQDDVDHIAKKQGFAIPEPEVRNALLRSYVEWVHPLCPVLDLQVFLSAVAQPNGSGGRISLLVLYAVLLAGAAHVDESHLIAAGYKSRLAARKDFFVRAKLLYSLGYEGDRLKIVQALLLLSYWQEIHDDPANHWYWAELGNNKRPVEAGGLVMYASRSSSQPWSTYATQNKA